MALVGQVEVQHGGFAPRMAHRPWHGSEIDPGFEPMRGRAVAEGMHADLAFHDATALLGLRKAPWTLLRCMGSVAVVRDF
jgi:hypothetical protein